MTFTLTPRRQFLWISQNLEGKELKWVDMSMRTMPGTWWTGGPTPDYFFIFKHTLVIWYLNRQNTIESSIFGREFIALRIVVEMIKALQYKLRSFGVPINGPIDIFCDNSSVVTNSTVSTSVLNCKHNTIFYHSVREAQAAGTVRVRWIVGKYNTADLAKKMMLSTMRQHDLGSSIFDDCRVMIEEGSPCL